MDPKPMQSFAVRDTISYGQFYLFSDGHTDPDALETSELVDVALATGNGFAQSLGSLVVLVPDLIDGCGQLTLRVERWSGPAPETTEHGFAGRFDIGPGGLLLGTVDTVSYQRIAVAPGRYEIRVAHEPSPAPGEATFWSARLYDAAGPAPRPPARRGSNLSTEKKIARVMDSLPRTGAWWVLGELRLDEEYNQILWDVAPTVTRPTIVNLYRTGITELPVWLTRVPYLVGLLAHDNDLDALPGWLPELRRLRRLAVSVQRATD